LLLRRDGRQEPLKDWALEIIDSMRGLCEMLDEGDPQRPYSAALAVQEEKVRDVSLTPAARTMQELHLHGESFFDFALRMSKVHRSYFRELFPPNEARQGEFQKEAEESIEQQRRIEASDRLSFDDYLEQYFSA
jgi:glutamate--cysteine ligase